MFDKRLQFDRETGKPKGFGFCEYYDADTAASAVRNLQGYDIMGRELRVNFATQKEFRDANVSAPNAGASPMVASGASSSASRPNYAQQQQQQRAYENTVIPTPGGNNPASATAAQSATDAITTLLATMSPAALIELMSQMKLLASQQPDQTRSLLQKNPPLAYAMFQALLMMNVISPITITKILNRMDEVPAYPAENVSATTTATSAASAPAVAASMIPPQASVSRAGQPPMMPQPPIPPVGMMAARPPMPAPAKAPTAAQMMMPPQMAQAQMMASAAAGYIPAQQPGQVPTIPANIPGTPLSLFVLPAATNKLTQQSKIR